MTPLASVLALAALLPTALAAPAVLRNACTPDGARCAGAPGKTYVPWLGCCSGAPVDCVAHPDFQSDPDNLYGRYCLTVTQPPATRPPAAGYYPTAPPYGDDVVDPPVTEAPVTDPPLMGYYVTRPRVTTALATKAMTAAPATTPYPATTAAAVTDAVADPADGDDKDTYSDGSSSGGDNPLAGMEMYVNPSFKADIDVSLASAADGAEKDNLAIMRNVPSAYWLDVKYKVTAGNDSTTESAEGIMKDAAAKSPAPLVSFIVYDLPNRDCHAKASNGEICCGKANADGTCDYLDNEGECASGLAEYKETYIDQLAVGIKKYCDKVPLALFIEPDSLPNLVTNTDDPKCGGAATQASYRQGITYAVKTLAEACPKATIYVDAAHGGWLGWPDNLKKFSEEIKGLGITEYIRGFSLNVANYQPVGVKCPAVGHCLNGMNADDACCTDPCGLAGEFNPAHSELNYAAALGPAMTEAMPGFVPHFVIDTGRNGKNPRTQCSNWCNVRGAGSGMLPTTKTGYPEAVDAYMWLKTPGESDGCTETLPTGGTCRRFDADCASVDSIGTNDGEPLAPEAGGWFDYQIKMLAQNADLYAGSS